MAVPLSVDENMEVPPYGIEDAFCDENQVSNQDAFSDETWLFFSNACCNILQHRGVCFLIWHFAERLGFITTNVQSASGSAGNH